MHAVPFFTSIYLGPLYHLDACDSKEGKARIDGIFMNIWSHDLLLQRWTGIKRMTHQACVGTVILFASNDTSTPNLPLHISYLNSESLDSFCFPMDMAIFECCNKCAYISLVPSIIKFQIHFEIMLFTIEMDVMQIQTEHVCSIPSCVWRNWTYGDVSGNWQQWRLSSPRRVPGTHDKGDSLDNSARWEHHGSRLLFQH